MQANISHTQRNSVSSAPPEIVAGARIASVEFAEENNNKDLTKKEILQDFCLTTTHNGFVRLIAHRGRMRKLWVALIVVATLAIVIHAGILIERFTSNKIGMSYIYDTEPMVYPAATFCLNFHYAFHTNPTRVAVPLRDVSGASMSAEQGVEQVLFLTLFKFAQTEYVRLGRSPSVASHLARILTLPFASASQMIFTASNTVVKCSFRGQMLNVTQWMEFPDPGRHQCFTFQPQHSVASGELKLRFLLNTLGEIETWEKQFLSSDEIESYESGLVVSLHPPKTMPDLSGPSTINVPRKSTTKIAVDMLKTDLIPSRSRPCIAEAQRALSPLSVWFWTGSNRTFEYTQEACEALQVQKRLYAKCGCFSENMPVPVIKDVQKFSQSLFCHHLQFHFWTTNPQDPSALGAVQVKVTNEAQLLNRAACFDSVMNPGIRYEFGEECPKPCEDVQYTFNVGATVWNTDQFVRRPEIVKELLNSVNESVNWAQDNNLSHQMLRNFLAEASKSTDVNSFISAAFVQLNVFTSRPFGVILMEKPVYELPTFISELGGVSGLWTGLSMVTFLELVEMAQRLIALRYNLVGPSNSQSSMLRQAEVVMSLEAAFEENQKNAETETVMEFVADR